MPFYQQRQEILSLGCFFPLLDFVNQTYGVSDVLYDIDTETEKVYQVKGLTQTWGEMIPYLKPPFPIKAATKNILHALAKRRPIRYNG